MEHYKDETYMQDTASSDFYIRKSEDASRSGVSTPKYPSPDRALLDGLESQIGRIREVLNANEMRLERLQSREELKVYVEETNQELAIIQGKNQAEMGAVKDDFEKNMGSLERELGSMKREWKNFKEKQEGALAEAMNDLRNAKSDTQITLTSLLKDTTMELKCKFATFGREARDLKKARNDRKATILQDLQLLRCTLNERVDAERKKRAEYQEIVLVLLDKTCEQGEKILRRIC